MVCTILRDHLCIWTDWDRQDFHHGRRPRSARAQRGYPQLICSHIRSYRKSRGRHKVRLLPFPNTERFRPERRGHYNHLSDTDCSTIVLTDFWFECHTWRSIMRKFETFWVFFSSTEVEESLNHTEMGACIPPLPMALQWSL